MMWDVLVVGGGASGLIAAWTAAKNGASVLLIEKEHRLGRRLATTGNGTCNLSHHGFNENHYNKGSRYFIRSAFDQFDEAATLAFFHALGLWTIIDERERYYPLVKNAHVVVDTLRLACRDIGIVIHTDEKIDQVLFKGNYFDIQSSAAHYRSKTVIMACGGEAAPQLGGTRSGYQLLEALGHECLPTRPAIVQLVTAKDELRGLRGLHWQVTLQTGDRVEKDEVLFTDYGLSGPATLQLSRAVSERLMRQKSVQVEMDLLPDMPAAEVLSLLTERAALFAERSLEEFLIGIFPRPLAAQLWRRIRVGPLYRKVSSLCAEDIQHLCRSIKSHTVRVVGTKDFKDAQVALGGINVKDFDPDTMASWIVPGLYACGEVLDVTGDCGGYNLQWAWSSGHLAGSHAARYVKE